METLLIFLFMHWTLAVFFQSFYLHRYCAHNAFEMNVFWSRFFQICTLVSQGSSYLRPRPYVILHREHHAFSDTADDPHSPHQLNFPSMVYNTYKKYLGFAESSAAPKLPLPTHINASEKIDRIGDSWAVRLSFVAAYTGIYIAYAPHWLWFLVLPIHFFIGPIHGLLVNWCGHKYGYRNFVNRRADQSYNTLVIDFLAAGELYQNNHHRFPVSANFAVKWYEIDTTYAVIGILEKLRVLRTVSKKDMPQRKQELMEQADPADPLNPGVMLEN